MEPGTTRNGVFASYKLAFWGEALVRQRTGARLQTSASVVDHAEQLEQRGSLTPV